MSKIATPFLTSKLYWSALSIAGSDDKYDFGCVGLPSKSVSVGQYEHFLGQLNLSGFSVIVDTRTPDRERVAFFIK